MKTEPNKTVDNKTTTENTPNTTKTAAKKPVDLAKEKAELKDQLRKGRPVQNLEATLEVLENLQKKMRQRSTLKNTIDKFNAFEIDLEEDEDEMGGNQYQDCMLMVKDDNQNRFETRNPVVIEAVANFIKDMCIDRLANIEAAIVLP
ncbi:MULTISPECIES: hypothetical protein [Sphingobacterium]|uniref:hypothetical protein n=1 Tax=Sphingobacterium TaxID=28453 RepID=UPI0028A75303|nr:hypothetical protein [Sphingobacterium multivorum]